MEHVVVSPVDWIQQKLGGWVINFLPSCSVVVVENVVAALALSFRFQVESDDFTHFDQSGVLKITGLQILVDLCITNDRFAA